MAAETCRVAGCLPPLRPRCNGHRPACTVPGDMYAQNDELVSMYAFIVQLMAPYCDFLLCHSMSCSREARAAALAAQAAGKDVWISWSVAAEPASCLLLGGATSLRGGGNGVRLPRCACHAGPVLSALLNDVSFAGASSGPFLLTSRSAPILGHTRGADASEGVAGGSGGTLPPGEYAKHAQAWIDGGSSIVGGGSGFLPGTHRSPQQAITPSASARRIRAPHPARGHHSIGCRPSRRRSTRADAAECRSRPRRLAGCCHGCCSSPSRHMSSARPIEARQLARAEDGGQSDSAATWRL